jgi:hypothetical protein
LAAAISAEQLRLERLAVVEGQQVQRLVETDVHENGSLSFR